MKDDNQSVPATKAPAPLPERIPVTLKVSGCGRGDCKCRLPRYRQACPRAADHIG